MFWMCKSCIYFSFSVFFGDLLSVSCIFFVAVAKALRGAAEGKALAQAEAAEWKRRYELEKSKNVELQHKGSLLT